ncbi:MAG: HD family phosphohydrolase [Muribaculaceae bacterium]|nr:HD family phosphohydrolase [Muribaculaceae bacterium]
MDKTLQDNKERFVELLKSTQREGVEYVIEDLESLGFFEAPASSTQHLNYDGGLVEHSLNVYDMAVMLKEQIIARRPDLEKLLPTESIIIASLLHDVCKADIYRKVMRRRKDAIGTYEEYQAYEVDYSNLPIGHGEKSVIMILRSGMYLEDDEVIAIRWHMSAWDLPFQSFELSKSLNVARDKSPLCSLIHTADTLAANLLERKLEILRS